MSVENTGKRAAGLQNEKGNNFTHIFFLGIGGIGMSALARFYQSKGYQIGGYDRSPSPLTDKLQTEGIQIVFDDETASVPTAFLDELHTLIIRTPAVPENEKLYTYFQEKGFRIVKRSEALGFITQQMRALCVAGTHGKTTTSTILAHLLYQSDINCNAFLGGISQNYGTNLLLSQESNYVVVEADEFDRSFHHLTPYISVITSVDPDHLDIYGDADHYRESFEYYTSLIQPGGALILKQGVSITPRLAENVRLYTYGVVEDESQEKPDFYADNIQIGKGEIHFDFHTPTEVFVNLKLGVPVYINIENSVAAMAVAWLNGVNASELRLGLASYTGIYRRFNIHVNNEHIAYIDDYAHHPTELAASIESIRRLFPERKLTGIFQPHLYSRTRDFADGFAKVLSTLDEVILLPIYPAREEPIAGVDSEMLLSRITCEKKSIVEKSELISKLQGRENEVIMTLGAGDIDRMVPEIKNALQ